MKRKRKTTAPRFEFLNSYFESKQIKLSGKTQLPLKQISIIQNPHYKQGITNKEFQVLILYYYYYEKSQNSCKKKSGG